MIKIPKLGIPQNSRRRVVGGQVEIIFQQGATTVSVYTDDDVCTFEKVYYGGHMQEAIDNYYSHTEAKINE